MLSDVSAPLIDALTRLLRPLVRLLIRQGVTCPMLMDLVRGVYVEEARSALGPGATDSRVALLTGIHRKELRRTREAGDAPAPGPVAIGSQVAARWLGAPGWQDAEGRPLPLPRSARDSVPSFETLVAGVTRDVRARTVLDEWLAQGLVGTDAEGRLVLQVSAFLPRPGGAEQAFYFGRNLHDHLAAASANLVADGVAPFLDRSVHYDGLSSTAAAALEAVARAAAQRMLVDVNREALAIAEADDRAATAAATPPGTDGRRCRVNLGAYLFRSETEE